MCWFAVDVVAKGSIRLSHNHDIKEGELVFIIFQFHGAINGWMDGCC